MAELEAQVAQLQQQLLQAQKMSTVGALASSITHEFNNILTTVINYPPKWAYGIRTPPPVTRRSRKPAAAGQRASKITTGMLVRRQHVMAEPMDLVTLVEDVMVLVEKDLQRYRVRPELRFEGRPWAAVNSGQVQQVLLNLIVNARQAMPNGGPLIISVRADQVGGFAELAVKDSGCGIPADKLPQDFRAVLHDKNRNAQGQGGTGLGLSLAKDVMESHGGRLRVESTVGTGTTFTLKFPLVASPRTTVPLRKKSADPLLVASVVPSGQQSFIDCTSG